VGDVLEDERPGMAPASAVDSIAVPGVFAMRALATAAS
jgi:hypothetical protein